MNMAIGCPIPGASQPKEPVRLIDIKEILQYDGAHFTWSGGRNCLTEQKAAYARGYDAGMKFIVDEAKKAPIIDHETLRSTQKYAVYGENIRMTQLQEAIRDKITKYSDACGMCTDTTKECDTCGITCVLEELNDLQKLANNQDFGGIEDPPEEPHD